VRGGAVVSVSHAGSVWARAVGGKADG
jgi:hypothetical protein